MHFDILIEDVSGKKVLEILVPRIIGENNTFTIHAYKGIGRLPTNLRKNSDPQKRILLNLLPRLLQSYGNAYAKYPQEFNATVIVVCDLDKKCLKEFRKELYAALAACIPQPKCIFCIAIEEGEAWFLGDRAAIKAAYPEVKINVLDRYINDSICNTWEFLADTLYPGGASVLKDLGWQAIGELKSQWATDISPHMDVENNASPSFCYFRDKLRTVALDRITST